MVMEGMSKIMKRIARFEKVSQKQFILGWMDSFNTGIGIYDAFEKVKLPKRATSGSAGYDFYALKDVELAPGESVKMATGVRVQIEEGWVLKIYPRSGLGFKYRMQLANTVGIIDSDYYYSDNEGHIFIKITNDSHEGKTLTIREGDAFAQGVFLEYGITVDDDVTEVRNGGFGSTGR